MIILQERFILIQRVHICYVVDYFHRPSIGPNLCYMDLKTFQMFISYKRPSSMSFTFKDFLVTPHNRQIMHLVDSGPNQNAFHCAVFSGSASEHQFTTSQLQIRWLGLIESCNTKISLFSCLMSFDMKFDPKSLSNSKGKPT